MCARVECPVAAPADPVDLSIQPAENRSDRGESLSRPLSLSVSFTRPLFRASGRATLAGDSPDAIKIRADHRATTVVFAFHFTIPYFVSERVSRRSRAAAASFLCFFLRDSFLIHRGSLGWHGPLFFNDIPFVFCLVWNFQISEFPTVSFHNHVVFFLSFYNLNRYGVCKREPCALLTMRALFGVKHGSH